MAAALRSWAAAAPAGARLPSSRALVAEHGVSPVTVQKALRTLAREGLVDSRPGVGTFVRAQRRPRPRDYGWQTAALGPQRLRVPQASGHLHRPTPHAIAFHSGYPDRLLLPEREVRAAFARAARGEAAVSRPPATGLPELQAWFAAELSGLTAPSLAAPTAGDVVVLPGSQSGLSTAFRALVGPGGPVLVESPTYWGALLAAAQVGVQVIPVPTSPQGPDPDELDRALSATGARALYAQPSFANPGGGLWGPERIDAVLAVLREHGAFLIEDDWAHDFGITESPSPAAARDDAGHVVYLRSLTKSVSPAVRVAGLIARGPARERILADTQAHAMYVSGALQAVALDVVSQPSWGTHLRRLGPQLEARRDLLVAELVAHVPEAHLEAVPSGGLNLWLRLPERTDLAELVRGCEDRGVLVASGDDWFPAEPTGPHLRLNFAGADPGSFSEGARILGEVLAGARD